MKKRVQRMFACFAIILLILSLTIASVVQLRNTVVATRQREAENVLFYYKEKIVLKMQGTNK